MRTSKAREYVLARMRGENPAPMPWTVPRPRGRFEDFMKHMDPPLDELGKQMTFTAPLEKKWEYILCRHGLGLNRGRSGMSYGWEEFDNIGSMAQRKKDREHYLLVIAPRYKRTRY